MKDILPSQPIQNLSHHKKSAECRSCGETYRDQRLEPYCSIVCRTLGQAGLGWRLNPYRVVDLESGIVLTTGPRFDLTPEGLTYLQRLAERLRRPASDLPAAFPLAEPLESAFSAAFVGSAI